MSAILVAAVLLLNLAVSWVNAYVCGKNWLEAKAVGGWVRVLMWCGAIQSAIGFSSIVLAALLGGAWALHLLPPTIVLKGFSLWYLLVIIPALGTGLLITIESWRVALRDRDLMSIGSAAYNTFAMWHNAAGAMDGIGKAFGNVTDLLPGGKDSDEPDFSLLVISLVLLALASGVLLTATIIKRYAGTVPLPDKNQTVSA